MARPKGAINKNKRGLLAELKRQYGADFHPIMKMAEHAVKMHSLALEENEQQLRKDSIDAWSKIAEYTEPKLKAMELDLTSGGESLPTIIELVAKIHDEG